ncbi:hypothetical protein L0F63_000188 [Massospora cicadina]|nr:hypothetical protein L0F63_000188 [Massospora cicadina]
MPKKAHRSKVIPDTWPPDQPRSTSVPFESASTQSIISHPFKAPRSDDSSYFTIPFDDYEFDPLAYQLKETIGGTNYHVFYAQDARRFHPYGGRFPPRARRFITRARLPRPAAYSRRVSGLPPSEKPRPQPPPALHVPLGGRYFFGGLFCFPLWFLGSVRASTDRGWRRWNRAMAAACSFFLILIFALAIWAIVLLTLNSGSEPITQA